MEDLANLPLDFNFDVSSLIAGVVFGLIGMWLFKRARKASDNRLIVIALLLMIYPYFVSGAIWNWGIGLVLCEAAYYFADT